MVGLHLPDLSDLRESIRPLAEKFLRDFSSPSGARSQNFSPTALTALEAFDWPGNVRELRNVIERAVALCVGKTIDLAELPQVIDGGDMTPEAALTKLMVGLGEALDPEALQEYMLSCVAGERKSAR